MPCSFPCPQKRTEQPTAQSRDLRPGAKRSSGGLCFFVRAGGSCFTKGDNRNRQPDTRCGLFFSPRLENNPATRLKEEMIRQKLYPSMEIG